LALKALRLPFSLSYDFDDEKVNRLLGLDETKEVALVVTQVFGDEAQSGESGEDIGELSESIGNASRVSGSEIEYPLIGEIHGAGMSIVTQEESEPEMNQELGVATENWTKNKGPSVWPEVMAYSEALFNRRSRRNFVKEPISVECIANAEGQDKFRRSLSIGLLAGQVKGMKPGFYLLDPLKEVTGRVTPGPFMEKMAHICLDQAWLTNAAVHFLFLTNLDVLDRIWGARGYRYAMMTAGGMGQRLYLAATAMGMGCCGIGAFYDGEAAELLGLKKESSLLYLVAVGPVKSKIISR
jgi:SagB-type dehydrogenase family enzyme